MKDIKYAPTGENRPPKSGEWFQGYNGIPKQANFDFAIQSFPILKMEVEIKEEAPPNGCTSTTVL